MENSILTAKGLLLGHRDDIVEKFLNEKIKNSFLIGKKISRHNSSFIYSNISDIMLELYQKTGIDLYFDNVDIFDNTVSFVVKYVDDNEELNINVKV